MPSLMESIISLDVGAQEPWPNDVQLFQPYPMEQILLPDNANCLATQAYLHMCGLPFKIEHRANAEFMSPSGKVPFIKCGAFVVSELEPIVQFVANKGISLTQDFDNEQKSDLRAYMSLIFSVLMNAELYICWCDKRTYNEVTKVRNGSVYPWPLNHYQNWTKRSAVIKKLKLLNWYQKTLGSVYQEVETCCQALSERLEGKEYFFGSKPTEADALLYGHTYAIFNNPVDFPNLFVIFQRFPNLIIHCRRICFNYTFLRYIDFTKTDTDIESSRQSSMDSILQRTETSIFTQLWNTITLNLYHDKSKDVDNSILLDNESATKQNCDSISQANKNEISFKKNANQYLITKQKFEEDDSPKSINYLGHKVIQQHLQQDLRNKLSDFTIDTNSDLWSERDICYFISDRELMRININKSDVYELDADDDTNRQIITNLDTKSTSHCSGSNSNSTISNMSEQLEWRHDSSMSTIDINYSNNKGNADSYTENKNDTLHDLDTIEIDADNKTDFHNDNDNDNEMDWLNDCSSGTQLINIVNNDIIQEIKTYDPNSMDVISQNILVPKFSNCSIEGDLDWLHDFTKDHTMVARDDRCYDEKHIQESLDLHEPNESCHYAYKPSKIVFTSADADTELDSNISKQCSTSAWTTYESASVSGDNSAIDNIDSTHELMNDMMHSVEQMTEYTLTEDTKLENYSDNHICNEYCDNIFVVSDDTFWDDDISKSVSEIEKGMKCMNQQINDNNNNRVLEKKHSSVEINCQSNKAIEKISNESLKKYFSCESYRMTGQLENYSTHSKSECAHSESKSSIIEEYPADKLSNVIIAVNQNYPENEFLKLLKSDYDMTSCSKSESVDHFDSMFQLHNCDENIFDKTDNDDSTNMENSNNNDCTNTNSNNSSNKPRVFRKCRRLLNRPGDANNTTISSDSKIVQMYNEKLLECRNKSNNDIENIRTACTVLKNFNTKPEQCKACSISNPSISNSCKCDSNIKIKSKSVNKFSSFSTKPAEFSFDNFSKKK